MSIWGSAFRREESPSPPNSCFLESSASDWVIADCNPCAFNYGLCIIRQKVLFPPQIDYFVKISQLPLLERGSTFLSSQLRTPQGTCFLRSLGPDLSIVEDGTENKSGSSDMRYFIGKSTQSHQNRKKTIKIPMGKWKSSWSPRESKKMIFLRIYPLWIRF